MGEKGSSHVNILTLVRIRDSQPLYDGIRNVTAPIRQILPDFTLGPKQYEDVCLEIFTRAVSDENEDGEALLSMFDKLFMSQKNISQDNAKRLCNALNKDFPDDRDWPEAHETGVRPPWR